MANDGNCGKLRAVSARSSSATATHIRMNLLVSSVVFFWFDPLERLEQRMENVIFIERGPRLPA